jgi:hypothetical protein
MMTMHPKPTPLKAKETVLLLIVMIGFAGTFHKPVFSSDIWHHLKMGEYIVLHGNELPKTDPFCYATEGKPVVHHEWLSQIILYHAHNIFGFPGIRAIRTILISAVVLLVFWLALRQFGHFLLALLILLIAAYLFRTRYLIRPELFSLLFFTFTYAWLETSRKNWTGLTYLLFFALGVLWINLHPFMLFGGAIISISVASQIAKRIPLMRRLFHFSDPPYNPTVLLCLFVMASLINPHGHRIYGYVFHAAPMVERYVSEWQSVFIVLQSDFFKDITGGVLAFPFIMKGLVIGILGVFLLVLLVSYAKRLKWSFEDVLLGLLMGYMAIKAARFVWLLFIPALLVVKYLKLLRNTGRLSEKCRPFGMALLYTGLAISLAYWIGEGYRRIPEHLGYQIQNGRYPDIPATILRQAELPGKLYSPNIWGSYLIYHLYPDYRPFIDTRSYLHGEANVKDAMIIQYQYPGFQALIEKHAFDILLFKKMYGDKRPFDSPDWILLFEDSNSAMYLRRNDRNTDNVRKAVTYYKEKGIPFDPEKGFDRKSLDGADFF